MSVTFELDGQRSIGLNGGPHYTFSPAVWFLGSSRETQDEVDHFWEKLGEGGDPDAQRCGWLKDRFGLPLADRPEGTRRVPWRQGPRQGGPGDGRHAQDGKA